MIKRKLLLASAAFYGWGRILVGVAALVAAGMGASFGAITSFVAPSGAGNSWVYSYSIDNLGSFPIVGWSLNFSRMPADWNQDDIWFGGDVQVPPDWVAQAGIPLPGHGAQDFISLGTFDVAPGGSLGWFSFRSGGKPGPAEYVEFGAMGESSTGRTVGPMPPTLCSPDSGPGLMALAGVAVTLITGSMFRRGLLRV